MPDTPFVGIIMGSESDLSVMRAAADALAELQISHEMDIVSAHRTPEAMAEYGKSAETRGLRVVIAGAGGAAHLPGMTASYTHLPVIGVPIWTKSMEGLDSLLSIMQMPAGIPVATVAVNGARNAGILAAEILGTSDAAIATRLRAHRQALHDSVHERAAGLRKGVSQPDVDREPHAQHAT